MASHLLPHNAPLRIRAFNKAEPLMFCIFILGAVIGFVLLIFTVVAFFSGDANALPLFGGFVGCAVASLGSAKLHSDWIAAEVTKRSAYGKALEIYNGLNKGHQEMAKSTMDKMLALNADPNCPSGALSERLARMEALQRKEVQQRVENVLTDDSDLVTLDTYLNDKSLNGGQ